MSKNSLLPWADGSDMAFVPVNLADQGVSFAQYEAGDYVAEEAGLTDDEIDQVLSGDYSPLGLTAAANEHHTDGMIALLPSEADMERIYIIGGEEDEELHLTLLYLGDAAKIAPSERDAMIEGIARAARDVPIVDASAFGSAMFNKKDGEKDTCVVLLVSGSELDHAVRRLGGPGQDVLYGKLPEQHKPWIPHVTLKYTGDQATLKKAQTKEGPIRFDRVRVAFGDEVTDFPLYDGTATSNTASMPGDLTSGDGLAEVAMTADSSPDLAKELGDYDGGWEGPLMVEDKDTGDGRMFSGGAVTWGDTTEYIHPFQWAPQNLGEHKGSVTAGRIDKIWRDVTNPRVIMGKGTFNVNDQDGLRAFQQVRDGYAGGVSVDPDQITDADVELEFALEDDPNDMTAKPTKTIFHAGRLRGATLVAFPALVEASIKLTKKGEVSSVVASISNASWSSVKNELLLGDDEIDGLVAAAAFAYVMDIDDVVSRRQCRFLHHEINEDGTPGPASLVACAEYINVINTGRTFGLNDQQIGFAYEHMAQHLRDAGKTPPKLTLKVDAMVAAITPTAPLEWFGKPELSGPTPVTVTDDGRVFGHAATWGTCHTGFADTCVTPPMENDYSYFTTGEYLTAEGHRVAVGQITLGTSHAATHGLSLARAIDHYGDTGTSAADVTCGTDEHGIWVAGAVRPHLASEHLHALRASALSGDWRRIGGTLRMVALLAVNVPGFPIPRVGTSLAAGKQVSLVAAGVVDRSKFTMEQELALLDGACGMPGIKEKHKKYTTLDEELIALDTDIKE